MNWDILTEKEVLRYAEPETPLEKRLVQLIESGISQASAREQEIEELQLELERVDELESEVLRLESEVLRLEKTIYRLRDKMDKHKIDHSGIE